MVGMPRSPQYHALAAPIPHSSPQSHEISKRCSRRLLPACLPAPLEGAVPRALPPGPRPLSEHPAVFWHLGRAAEQPGLLLGPHIQVSQQERSTTCGCLSTGIAPVPCMPSHGSSPMSTASLAQAVSGMHAWLGGPGVSCKAQWACKTCSARVALSSRAVLVLTQPNCAQHGG